MPAILATPGVNIRRITVQGRSTHKVSKAASQATSLVWWYMPVVPSTPEAIGKRITEI
jgi:hypothetical protein